MNYFVIFSLPSCEPSDKKCFINTMLEFLEKCSMPYLGFFLLFIGKLESKYNSNIYTYYYSNTNVAQISINCH